MNPLDAFLLFSSISYFICIFFPKPVTKNVKSRTFERLFMAMSGALLTLNLVLDIRLLWLTYAVIWTIAAGASYLGYTVWNVLWKKEPSEAAQMTMFAWDALIAICCLLKF